MQLFFSLYFQLYTDSKLFCIKLLCLDFFLSVFPCCCPALCSFLDMQPSWPRGSAVPCGGLSWSWLGLGMSGTEQPRPLLSSPDEGPPCSPRYQHLGMGSGHDGAGTPKRQEAAPAWPVPPPVISAIVRESSLAETGQCHPSHGGFLNMMSSTRYPHCN